VARSVTIVAVDAWTVAADLAGVEVGQDRLPRGGQSGRIVDAAQADTHAAESAPDATADHVWSTVAASDPES
jgi:hypothetical protein